MEFFTPYERVSRDSRPQGAFPWRRPGSEKGRVEYLIHLGGVDRTPGEIVHWGRPEVCRADDSRALRQGLVVCIIVRASAVHSSIPSCVFLWSLENCQRCGGIPIPVFGNTGRGSHLFTMSLPIWWFSPSRPIALLFLFQVPCRQGCGRGTQEWPEVGACSHKFVGGGCAERPGTCLIWGVFEH